MVTVLVRLASIATNINTNQPFVQTPGQDNKGAAVNKYIQ